jgi:hypothetical protein
MGDGTVNAWIHHDETGTPVEVGVTLSENALENLPAEPAEYLLEFPDVKGSDFYTHVTLEWNPAGHEPPGIYDLPHFDFHFYSIPVLDRISIGFDMEAFAHAPDADYVPEDYFQTEGGVPAMGAHWLDGTSPELNGEVFTKTFIWGSFDGEFIFWEPMITRDYLLSQPDVETVLKLPQAYQRDGYYATKYKVSFSSMESEYQIALTGLEYHSATLAK